jgi:hypothetical protein
VPVVLGVIAALLFAAVPGAPAWTLAKGVSVAKDVRAEIAALNAARMSVIQARMAERDVLAGQSARARDEAAASLDAIDTMLGRLATHDEAMLRAPFLDVRLAGTALMSRAGFQPAQQLARSAGSFTARLAEVTIPDGTRISLAAKLAAYEHAVLSVR